MGSVSCPEMSVRNYHYSLRNDPEERSSHLLRGGSLKSRRGFVRRHFDCRLLSLYRAGVEFVKLGRLRRAGHVRRVEGSPFY